MALYRAENEKYLVSHISYVELNKRSYILYLISYLGYKISHIGYKISYILIQISNVIYILLYSYNLIANLHSTYKGGSTYQ